MLDPVYLHCLDAAWCGLGPRARHVLLLIAERLAMRVEHYQGAGQLDRAVSH